MMTKPDSLAEERVSSDMNNNDYFQCSLSPLSTRARDLVDVPVATSSMAENNTFLSSDDWEDIWFSQSSNQEQNNFVSTNTITTTATGRSSFGVGLRGRAASASAAVGSSSSTIASNGLVPPPQCYSSIRSKTLDLSTETDHHKSVWNSQINWSRSTVEISSDEESLPSSASSAEMSELIGLQGLEDVMNHHQGFEIVSLNSHNTVPPFRSRAYTAETDIVPWRRTIQVRPQPQQQQQQLRPNHSTADGTTTDRGLEHRSADFSNSSSSRYHHPSSSVSNERRKNKQRVTPGRGIMFLFLIATYTTFWLPYPEFPDLDRVEDILLLNPSLGTSNDTTSFSDGTISTHTIRISNAEEKESDGHHRASAKSFITNGIRGGGGGAAFARRNNQLKEFRTEEMKSFLQQRAIRQHYQSTTWIPWHANVTILGSVAVWLVVDWTRKRRSMAQTVS